MFICPSCSGTSGYRYTETVEVRGRWGIPGLSDSKSVKPRSVYCLDCGFRTKRKRAEGNSRKSLPTKPGEDKK